MELIEAAYKNTQFDEITPIDTPSLVDVVSNLMANPAGEIKVAHTDVGEVVGVSGGMLLPMWYNRAHVTGQQMFWYVHPDHRRSKAGGMLLTAIEAWAKEAGAESFVVASADIKHRKRLAQIFKGKGYADLEISFIKEL